MQFQLFHDFTRDLLPVEINPMAVAAVAHRSEQYGKKWPDGCPVRQVWLVGGTWFFLHDDGTLIDRLQQGGAQI